MSDEFLKFEHEEKTSSSLHRSQSNQSFSSRDLQFLDSGVHDTKSLNEDALGEIQIPVLTEAQHKALRGDRIYTDTVKIRDQSVSKMCTYRGHQCKTVPV